MGSKDADGLGQLAGLTGAAAELAQDTPGERAASSPTASFTYRQAVAVPTPNPSRQLSEHLALAQMSQHKQGLLARAELAPA